MGKAKLSPNRDDRNSVLRSLLEDLQVLNEGLFPYMTSLKASIQRLG